MKKKTLHSPTSVRYATIALIVVGIITVTLGIRDSMLFEGIRPMLVVGCILLVAGLALLALTYIRAERTSIG